MSTHRIYFNARNWDFNKTCLDNTGERCFISGLYGQLEEVFIIGSRSNRRTEIVSKPMMLEKNRLYRFCFWVRDGENEEKSEVCQLHVVFDGKSDQVYHYRLNGDFIHPIKVVQGWRLYDLFFETHHSSVTQLKFVVERATMTIMHASDPEDYTKLKDDRSPVQTSQMEKKATHTGKNPLDFGPFIAKNSKEVLPLTSLTQNEIEATNLYQQIIKKLEDGVVQQQIVEDILSQIVERVEKEIDIDSLVKDVSTSINIGHLNKEIRQVIKDNMGKK